MRQLFALKSSYGANGIAASGPRLTDPTDPVG